MFASSNRSSICDHSVGDTRSTSTCQQGFCMNFSCLSRLEPNQSSRARSGSTDEMRVAMREAQKPVPDCANARQDLDFERQSAVALGVGADSVKMERVNASRVGDTLAKEDRLVSSAFKMLGQMIGKICRG